MPLKNFDSLKYARRLEQAGMPHAQAEIQAETLAEAFAMNLESLVTRDYLEPHLDARFAEQKAYIDSRFAEQNACINSRFAEQKAYIDTRFAKQKAYIDTRFAEQKAYMDARFAEQKAYMDTRFAELMAQTSSRFRTQSWILGIILAAVILPYFERMLTL